MTRRRSTRGGGAPRRTGAGAGARRSTSLPLWGGQPARAAQGSCQTWNVGPSPGRASVEMPPRRSAGAPPWTSGASPTSPRSADRKQTVGSPGPRGARTSSRSSARTRGVGESVVARPRPSAAPRDGGRTYSGGALRVTGKWSSVRRSQVLRTVPRERCAGVLPEGPGQPDLVHGEDHRSAGAW